MLNKLTSVIKNRFPAEEVSAHCDGPCGVYDPAQARVHAEAVLSMTKKILALDAGAHDHATVNTMSRFIAIKEEEAHATKTDLLVLWTDFFKPAHLEQFPDLHDKFWAATKQCSKCKTTVDLAAAEELMAMVEGIHNMFWAAKGKEVAWTPSS